MKRSPMPPRTTPLKPSFSRLQRKEEAEAKPAKGPRKRFCKHCKTPFTPFRDLEAWCSPVCGLEVAKARLAAQRAKLQRKERAADKVKRDSLKSRQDWLREAQTALNRWIRLVRDFGKPCISCDRHHQGQLHSGHYLSRGAHPNLALVEENLHLQCAPCNVHLSGNQINFRLGLIKRYGVEYVEALESDNEPRKHTIEQLQEIKAHYTRLVREFQKEFQP